MLIKYFRRLQTLTPLLLFIIGGVLWVEVYLDPEPVFFFYTENAAPFYAFLQSLFLQHPFTSWIAAYLFLFLQSLMINQVLTSQGILDKYSFFASLLYMILMSTSRGLLYLHPVLFSNFFLLLALHKIFKTYDQEEVMVEVFNVGMLISVAGMFYAPSWLYFVFLLICLFIFYLIGLRSFIAASLGFMAPFFFTFLALFLADKFTPEVFDVLFYPAWFGYTAGSFSAFDTALFGFLAGLTLLAFFHLVFIYLPDKPIRLRKRLWVLVYFFLLSLITFLFVPQYQTFHAGLMTIPLSAVLAVFFHQIDKKVIAEVLFTILLGLIVAGKLGVHF